MKQSGVSWLGEIPENWEVAPLKTAFIRVKRPTVSNAGIVTAFRDGEVTLRSNRRSDGYTEADDYSGYQRIIPSDLAIHSMDAFAGAIGVSDSDGICSPVLSVCVAKNGNDPRYMAYQLRIMSKRGWIEALSRSVRERTSEFRWAEAGAQKVALPPVEEQKAIADFLDRELTQIDRLVSLQDSFIGLLAERSKALVRKTILEGLELERPTKKTSLPWVPSIPINWDTKPLWMVLRFESGWTPPSGNDEYFEGDNLWANISDLGPRTLAATQKCISDVAVNQFRLKIVKPGSLLFSFKLSIGQVSITEVPMFTNEAIAAFEPNDFLDIDYMYYMLPIAVPENATENIYGAKMLNAQRIKQARVVIPPKDEQVQIAKFLQKELFAAELIVKKATETKEALLEKRQALINAAVTGKIDVRGKN